MACDTKDGEFRWEGIPPNARGTAKRDGDTGEITYERKTLAEDHRGCEIWMTDDVKSSHSHMGATLRKQTTADGSRFRYVQTFHFIKNGSIRREKNKYPSYAKELLVGSWIDNPSFHSTSNSSCAEKDNNPPISPPDAKEWMMVDPRTSKEWMMVDTGTEQNENKDWEEVPGSTWAVVHQTGSSAIDGR